MSFHFRDQIRTSHRGYGADSSQCDLRKVADRAASIIAARRKATGRTTRTGSDRTAVATVGRTAVKIVGKPSPAVENRKPSRAWIDAVVMTATVLTVALLNVWAFQLYGE